MRAAHKAFTEGEWPKLTATQRGALLRKLGDLIGPKARHLAEIEVKDNGKLISEMGLQTAYMAQWYYYFGGLADKIEGAVNTIAGLHAHEKRWTQLFSLIAGPLFLAGVGVAYYVLPRGMEVLIGFTPAEVQSLIEFDKYLSFIIRMMLVFGVAFEIPVFVVMLNLAGIVRGKTLGTYRPWIVVGTFIFAAVATPSTDPFSMIMLAIPMSLLFLVSEGIARLVDKRRDRREDSFDGLSDDEASPLDDRPDAVRRSSLAEEDD